MSEQLGMFVRDELELGIIMRDVGAMMAFYGDALGLPLEGSFATPGIGIRHKFRVGANSIKLIELDRPIDAAPIDGLPWAANGLRYWTGHVLDLRAALDRIRTGSGAVLAEISEPKPGVWFAIVTDPDGNGIELVQGA